MFFRSEEHVDRWCKEMGVARGDVVSLQTMWRLAEVWYAGRLNIDWTPRTPDAIQGVFNDVGLTGDFWRVT
jgi:hypothetical protein